MKVQKLLTILFVLAIALAVYSCTKEKSDGTALVEKSAVDQTISTRDNVGEACDPDLENCLHGTYSWRIELPQYPGCEFEVEVDYAYCSGLLNSVAIHLGDFVIVDHDCQDYTDDYDDALTNGTFDQFIIDFNQSVWTGVTENLISSFSGSSIHTVYEVVYVVGACKFACGSSILDCGDACCRKIDRYGYVVDRWEVVDEGDIERFGDTCDTEPFCSPMTLQTDDCYDNCDSLDF